MKGNELPVKQRRVLFFFFLLVGCVRTHTLFLFPQCIGLFFSHNHVSTQSTSLAAAYQTVALSSLSIVLWSSRLISLAAAYQMIALFPSFLHLSIVRRSSSRFIMHTHVTPHPTHPTHPTHPSIPAHANAKAFSSSSIKSTPSSSSSISTSSPSTSAVEGTSMSSWRNLVGWWVGALVGGWVGDWVGG